MIGKWQMWQTTDPEATRVAHPRRMPRYRGASYFLGGAISWTGGLPLEAGGRSMDQDQDQDTDREAAPHDHVRTGAGRHRCSG